MPYISRRWLGGTLTNFKIISDRLLYWAKLEEEAKSADFEKYSKKERLLKTIELEKLSKTLISPSSTPSAPTSWRARPSKRQMQIGLNAMNRVYTI